MAAQPAERVYNFQRFSARSAAAPQLQEQKKNNVVELPQKELQKSRRHRVRPLRAVARIVCVLGICLVTAAVAGWFLLLDDSGGTGEVETPPVEAAAPAEVPVELSEAPAEPEVPETPPEPAAQVPAAAMPEVSVPEPEVPVVAEAPQLVVSPLSGKVVAAFSVDQLVYSETMGDWRTHDGIDISAQAGTKVLAASAGTVLAVEDDALMGTTVTLRHSGGYQTTYACLQATPAVEQGDTVTAGQVIGAVGTTAAAESAQGPHLHFSVTKDGDAVDPEEYLNK